MFDNKERTDLMRRQHLKKAVCAAVAAAVMYSHAMVTCALDLRSMRRIDENELVRVIVTVKGEPVLAGEDAAEMGTQYLETDEAAEKTEELIDNQTRAVRYIRGLYPDMEKEYAYTALINGFSCEIPAKLIGEIEKSPYIEKVYRTHDHLVPHMYKAPKLSGVPSFRNDTGHTGEGEVIAVIDTEIDITHDMFAPIDDKKVRLTKEDIQRVKDSEAGFNTPFEIDVDRAYVSSKLPFVVNYGDENSPYELADKDNYHGTHVAGIAAGNEITDDSGRKIGGIAPDAQIIFMSCKVDGGYINDAVAVAAMEDAVKLNVSSVNLSFGMDSEFGWDMYEEIFDSAENSGVVVCAAAGNEAKFDYSPENPDTSTISMPSAISSAFSVAAAGCSYEEIGYMKLEGCTEDIPYMDGYDKATLASVLGGKTLEYVYCDGGEEEDYEGKDVKDKLVLIDSNKTVSYFSEIGEKAFNAGALGVICIGNSDEDEIYRILGDYLPMVLIKGSDGQKLLEAADKRITVSETGTTRIIKGGICYFSSFGVSQSLELKPDIAGIGGGVYSASYGNQLESLSGTSMATPYIAGCAALVNSYTANKMPELEGGDKVRFIKNVMMNTAKPFVKDGLYVSPREQGAGLADLTAITDANVLMTGKEGYAKIQLFDGITDTFETSVNIKNLSGETVSFDEVSLELSTDSSYKDFRGEQFIDGRRSLNASVTGLDGLKTLKPHEEKTVKLTIKLDSDVCSEVEKTFKNGFFVEGFITLGGAPNSSDISIPMLGYYGDWAAIPIFDKLWSEQGSHSAYTYFMTDLWESTIPLDVSFSKLAMLYNEYVLSDEYGWIENGVPKNREEHLRNMLAKYYHDGFSNATVEDFEGIFNKELCVSPNMDSWGDDLMFNFVPLRESTTVGIEIYDMKGNLVLSPYFEEEQFDSGFETVLFSNIMDELPEGRYKAMISSYINYPGAEDHKQQISAEFVIDNTAPEISNIKLEEKDGRSILSFTAKDEHLDGIYVLGIGTGGVCGEYDPSEPSKGYDLHVVEEMMSDFTPDLHYHDEDEEDMYSKIKTTLFNDFVYSSNSGDYDLVDADFFDIIHVQPDEKGSFEFKYDVTDLEQYSISVLDTAFNIADYGAEIPYVGNISISSEVEEGKAIDFKAPEITSVLPIKSQGWQYSFDNETWNDFDPTRPLTSDDNMMYVRYYADNGVFTGYSNSVTIRIKGVVVSHTSVKVLDKDGNVVESMTVSGDYEAYFDVPEGDYTIIVSDKGFVPRTYEMHIDSENYILRFTLAKPGDVDLNGKIDIADAVMLINSINGVKPLDDYQEAVADVDLSKHSDIKDAAAIISHINGVKALNEYTG